MDWGLGPQHFVQLNKVYDEINSSPLAVAALRKIAGKRAQEAALELAENQPPSATEADTAPVRIDCPEETIVINRWCGSPQKWPPVRVVDPISFTTTEIRAFSLKDRKRYSRQFVTSEYWQLSQTAGHKSGSVSGSAGTIRYSSYFAYFGTILQYNDLTTVSYRRSAIDIFGEEATIDSSRITYLIRHKQVGSEGSPGRSPSVPHPVTRHMAEYVGMLRGHKIPVYKSTVIACFKTLIQGSDLAPSFKDSGGSWDEPSLNNWYFRNLLGRNKELRTGGQNPLAVVREKWCHGDTVKPFYDDTAAFLLEVFFYLSTTEHYCVFVSEHIL